MERESRAAEAEQACLSGCHNSWCVKVVLCLVCMLVSPKDLLKNSDASASPLEIQVSGIVIIFKMPLPLSES